MARKQIRVSRRMLFTWFMLGGFILLFTPQELTSKFQFSFAHIFRWPLSISRNVLLSARMQRQPTDLVSRREYNKLQNHLANVTEQVYQEHQKHEKLSGLRNMFPLESARLVLADVITASIDGLRSELIINRGQDSGLAEGQFVLGDNSIIGIISSVDSRIAQVRLITDPASRIAVKVAGLNAGRLMQGTGENLARIELIKHKVKADNIVYADKKPGFLDSPMIVGKVSECRKNDESPLLWDITVKPVCDIERLKGVAVIIMNGTQFYNKSGMEAQSTEGN